MLTPSYRYIIFSYSLLIIFVSPMKVYRCFLSPRASFILQTQEFNTPTQKNVGQKLDF
jgi:hypothetical protein